MARGQRKIEQALLFLTMRLERATQISMYLSTQPFVKALFGPIYPHLSTFKVYMNSRYTAILRYRHTCGSVNREKLFRGFIVRTCITRIFNPVSCASCSRICRVGFGVAANAAFSVSSCLALIVVRGPRRFWPPLPSSAAAAVPESGPEPPESGLLSPAKSVIWSWLTFGLF